MTCAGNVIIQDGGAHEIRIETRKTEYTETRFAKYSNIYEVKVISDRGSGVNKPTFACVDNGETTVKHANGRSVAV